MPSNQVMPDSETGDGKPGLHAPPRQCGGKWTWIGLAAFLVAIAVIAPTTIILTRGSNNDNFAQQAEDIAILSGAGVQVVITIRTTGTYSEALMVGEGYCTELKSEGTFTKCRATVVRADSRRRLQQSDAYNIIVIGDTPAVTPGNANGNTKAEVKGNVADVLKYFSRRGIVVAVAVQCAVNTFIVNAACTPCTSCSAGQYNSGATCTGAGTANTVVCVPSPSPGPPPYPPPYPPPSAPPGRRTMMATRKTLMTDLLLPLDPSDIETLLSTYIE